MKPKIEKSFRPVAGKKYDSRTAMLKGGQTFTEILLDGSWWKVNKHPTDKRALLLSDPSSPDDPNTISLG